MNMWTVHASHLRANKIEWHPAKPHRPGWKLVANEGTFSSASHEEQHKASQESRKKQHLKQ